MGAVLGAVLANPLTTTRDFVEHALAAASPCIPPWSATGRVRANAAAFAAEPWLSGCQGVSGDVRAVSDAVREVSGCQSVRGVGEVSGSVRAVRAALTC